MIVDVRSTARDVATPPGYIRKCLEIRLCVVLSSVREHLISAMHLAGLDFGFVNFNVKFREKRSISRILCKDMLAILIRR